MKEFFIEDGWQKILTELGIDSYEKMLTFRGGECLSLHRRGATYRLPLPGQDDEHLFLKCDYFTHKKEVLKDIFCFRAPAQNSVKERRGFAWARAAGIIVPQVIAWGRTTIFGIPTKSAMVMREIHGISLQNHLTSGGDRHYIDKAEHELRKLFEAGYFWPDYKPEHFIIMPDGGVALIDLERMTHPRHPLSQEQIEARLQDFRVKCAQFCR